MLLCTSPLSLRGTGNEPGYRLGNVTQITSPLVHIHAGLGIQGGIEGDL